MADGRFTDIIYELLGVRSPNDIKQEELSKLLREHFGDSVEENYLETQAGIIYRKLRESEPDEE